LLEEIDVERLSSVGVGVVAVAVAAGEGDALSSLPPPPASALTAEITNVVPSASLPASVLTSLLLAASKEEVSASFWMDMVWC
jgi:hypothetical protein